MRSYARLGTMSSLPLWRFEDRVATSVTLPEYCRAQAAARAVKKPDRAQPAMVDRETEHRRPDKLCRLECRAPRGLAAATAAAPTRVRAATLDHRVLLIGVHSPHNDESRHALVGWLGTLVVTQALQDVRVQSTVLVFCVRADLRSKRRRDHRWNARVVLPASPIRKKLITLAASTAVQMLR